MFVEKGLGRHPEVNLQFIIASCLKGGNQDLLERAKKALKTKRRMKQISPIYAKAVSVCCTLLKSRILG